MNRLHHDLGAKMAAFAGWDMPIQYAGGILAEHRAVRTAAGLFDIAHMSALEVSGPHALGFLEALLANCVSRLDVGRAQYSCLLYPDGTAVDDVYVYRRERDRFMLVVNAGNAERVKDWIEAVNAKRVLVDPEMPAKALDGPADVRDLRDAGEDSVVGLALQGPASLRVLRELTEREADRAALSRLPTNAIVSPVLAGMPVLVARTGYTGEKLGYEIYLHPEGAERLWGAVLDEGASIGVLPAGLGARDSTRVEAGLPLFGHELEGELGISMSEAGYAFVMRFHVPFFIGRSAYMERVARSRRHILRLQGQGRKSLRPGHVILDGEGRAAGQVTSFAYVHEDMTFVALACVKEAFCPEPGERVIGARVSAEKFSGTVEERSVVELTALERFPGSDEREAWAERYA